MMWSDKAFGIWMGHAGEDTQVFAQDETPIDSRRYKGTQVLAIARHSAPVAQRDTRSRSQLTPCESEGIAA